MGRLFDGPWPIVIIIVVALLLFAAPKLPAMARSVGHTMGIIKSEFKEIKNDGKTDSTDTESGPVEGKIVNHPQAKPAPTQPGEPTNGTDVPPSNRA